MSTTKTAPPHDARATAMFDQAVQTFGDALKSGVKIQEEVGKFWTDSIDQTAPLSEWQKHARAIVGEAIPAAQRNSEEWLKLVEANYRRSVGLLKKAFDTDVSDGDDIRRRTQRLWEESLELIKENAQAMANANVKMMELWAGMLKKNVEGFKAAGK